MFMEGAKDLPFEHRGGDIDRLPVSVPEGHACFRPDDQVFVNATLRIQALDTWHCCLYSELGSVTNRTRRRNLGSEVTKNEKAHSLPLAAAPCARKNRVPKFDQCGAKDVV